MSFAFTIPVWALWLAGLLAIVTPIAIAGLLILFSGSFWSR